MLGLVLIVLTVILGSCAYDPLGIWNIREQRNMSEDAATEFVSALAAVPVRFQNVLFKTCVDLGDSGRLKLARCDSGQSQLWEFLNGHFRNKENSRCMEMTDGGTFFVARCDNFKSQTWEPDFRVGFKGELLNLREKKCVDRQGLLGQPCDGTIDQRWERIH